MRILTINSSLRRDGNTARLVDLIETELVKATAVRHQPLELDHVSLGDLDVRPCRGCRACFDRGETACPLKDDVPEITAKLRAADGILLASPIYINDVNGVAKTLLDRLSFMCHRPELAGKCVYAVTTVGSSPGRHALRTLTLAPQTWGATVVGSANFKTGALTPKDDIAAQYSRRINFVADKLVGAIATQRYRRPSFVNLMMFRIQQGAYRQADPDTVDYAYWRGQGWLAPDCVYYIDTNVSRIKVALARLTGAVISHFVA